MSDPIERREFLKLGAAATLGLSGLGMPEQAWSAPEGEPRVRRYSRLGRTGLEIADISYGSSRTTDPSVVRHAFERGVNYFDTAESYKDGASEESIGEALAGKRDEILLASKVAASASASEAEMMRALEGSLKRLRTDRIDIYFNHAVNDVDRMKNEAWYSFTDKAKAQGKIRFTGVSGHAGRLIEVLDYVVDNDLVDVILCAYNFGADPAFYERLLSRTDMIAVQPELPRVLEKAKKKDIGIVAMKTLRGARLNDMRPFEKGGATFAQAAFRWTLSSPHVDALVISMKDKAMVDEYLGASGAPAPSAAELDLLEDYLLGSRDGYCEHGCDACHTACPSGVTVSEVLRTRMYATDYGDLAYAREDYAKLGRGAAACAGCAVQSCVGACPGGLRVSELTRQAHRLLG